MRFRLSLAALLLFTSLAAVPISSAQNPFAGTWKLNLQASQMSGELLRFGPAAGGSMEFSGGGITYSFRTDGQTYALPSGDAAIWRQTAPDSWTTEYRKLDNKLLYSDQWKVSSDGNTLTLTSSGDKANGDLYTNTYTYTRTAGAGGLLGSWKSTSVELSSPNELIIEEQGLDRLDFRIPELKAHAELTMDGNDAAIVGPDIPTGMRLSLTRTGPYSMKLVQKLNGTVTRSSVYSIEPDKPKIMTQVGGAPGDPPANLIWERQIPKAKPDPKKAAAASAPVRR